MPFREWHALHPRQPFTNLAKQQFCEATWNLVPHGGWRKQRVENSAVSWTACSAPASRRVFTGNRLSPKITLNSYPIMFIYSKEVIINLIEMAINRIPTGIKGFDKLIQGGFPKGSITLVSGTPGTGKSIFCLQTVYNNALKGSKCLYISFEQNMNDIIQQLEEFGMKYSKVDKTFNLLVLDSDDPKIIETIDQELEKKYDFVVFDSLASLAGSMIPVEKFSEYTMEQIHKAIVPVPMNEDNVMKLKVKQIIKDLKKTKSTCLVITEVSRDSQWFSRDTVSEFLCDGVIMLQLLSIGAQENRTLHILKMRGTEILSIPHKFCFDQKGVSI